MDHDRLILASITDIIAINNVDDISPRSIPPKLYGENREISLRTIIF